MAWSSRRKTRKEERDSRESFVGSTDHLTGCRLRSFTVMRWVVIKDIEYRDDRKMLREEMMSQNQRH